MNNQAPINRRLILVALATVVLCALVPALLWVFIISPRLAANGF